MNTEAAGQRSESEAGRRGHTLAEFRGEEQYTATRELTCRHCSTRNRVLIGEAVEHPARVRCGRCRQPLFLDDGEPLGGIVARCYQHELDRQTLAALQKLPGLDALIKWLLKELGERSWKLFNMASAVRCGPGQFARFHELFQEAARRLDVQPVPELYVVQSPSPNALTSGVDEPFVVATSAMLEMMSEQELLSVFGHELGHIQANHVLYKTLAQVMSNAAAFIAQATLGIGRLVLYPLQLALLKWDRCSELTADRASLLAVRNPDVVVRTAMKLAGGGHHLYGEMSSRAFIQQSRDLAELEKGHVLNQAISLLQNVGRTHPFPVWRTYHLLDWVDRGEYLDILSGSYERRS
ncbi:MAG: hypothetical protein FJ125_00325 [Deltaproteobacteria bacterium]|nr:hypothetical protein [Deltaproteobacteria bacterium]